jgi:hypothetical protein
MRRRPVLAEVVGRGGKDPAIGVQRPGNDIWLVNFTNMNS